MEKELQVHDMMGDDQEMVNGDLILESQVGVGTRAVIMIPKEVTE